MTHLLIWYGLGIFAYQIECNMNNELYFDQDGRERLISGIRKISKAVKSTLGPLGKTVVIESPHHTRGLTVTKDGVTVAKSISLKDDVENLAVRMMKDAADRTATSAGDGTTTAIVLTEAMIEEGLNVAKDINMTEVSRLVTKLTDELIADLGKKAKKVSGRTLKDVATISANNDRELGKLIAEVYSQVGKDGVVTVENSETTETYYEVTDGIKIDRGYASRLFINNQKTDECILDDVYILCTDLEINSIMNIEEVLKPIIQQNKKLLIIGNPNQNVINTMGMNVVKNGLKICSIVPPQFGYKTKELMSDIAMSVGAKYFSESTGDDLSLITMADLGHAKKVVVGQDKTVIIRDEKTSDEVEARIEELKGALDRATKKGDKDFIRERIASLNGGIGVIYVGGDSDIEQKEKFDRVDDAVCAVRSAIEEGILPGGGTSLYLSTLSYEKGEGREMGTAKAILNSALIAPIMQILENAGQDTAICTEIEEFGEGYNVKTMEFGNMYKMGIIDPAKVTKNALKNAVSVAMTILTTNAIITICKQ